MVQKKTILWAGILIISVIILLVSVRAYLPTLVLEYVPESAGNNDVGQGWLAGLTAVASLISTIVSTIGMTYTITQSRLEIEQLRAYLRDREQQKTDTNGSDSNEV